MECVCCYSQSCVHISGTKSGMFSVDVGLPQGWSLSLILFVTFMDSWGGSGIKLRCLMGCYLWRFSNHAWLGRDPRVGPEPAGTIPYLVWLGNALGSPRRNCLVYCRCDPTSDKQKKDRWIYKLSTKSKQNCVWFNDFFTVTMLLAVNLTLLESLVVFLKWCKICNEKCICQFRVEDVGCVNERQIFSAKACLEQTPTDCYSWVNAYRWAPEAQHKIQQQYKLIS